MDATLPRQASAPVIPKTPADEKKFVWLLCLLAALHVFIYAAAFPTFNVNDEAAHFDLAIKYSHGDVPRGIAYASGEWLRYYALFGSPEYYFTPESLGGSVFPAPLWTHPIEELKADLPKYEQARRTLNHESSQPPLYYLLAGAWWRMGEWCGFHDGYLLYWLRFLNVPLVAALVWIGYACARLAFPGRKFLRLAVPALLACMPQTVFYSVTNDILSPLCFGLAFIGLLRWRESAVPEIRHSLLLGAALAATFLTKLSNLPLVAITAAFLIADAWRLAKAGKLRASIPAWLCLLLSAGVPIILWMLRCRRWFGDFTGSEEKVRLLGWTHKSIAEWFHHPLFTPRGMWIFCHDLLASFWRGEFLWRRQPLASPILDAVLVFVSLGLAAVAVTALCRRSADSSDRRVMWFCIAAVLGSMGFLGFLSVIYDFHACAYPSREYPYFASGRLMLGAAIPFLLVWVYGLDHALKRVTNRPAPPLILAGWMFFLLAAEAAVDWPVFFSQYNWFHLGE